MNLINDSRTGDLTNLVPNGEWEVIAFPMTRHMMTYDGLDYPEISSWIVIRRYWSSFDFLLIHGSGITYLSVKKGH